MKLSKTECSVGDTVQVQVQVTNTGLVDGMETVQLYVRDVTSSVVTPVKQLRGFEKVPIGKGETRTVVLPLRISDLYIVTPDEKYLVEPGEFTIMVGSSSRDCDLLKASLWVR